MAPSASPSGPPPSVCVVLGADPGAARATLTSAAETIAPSVPLLAVGTPDEAREACHELARDVEVIPAPATGLGSRAAAAISSTGTTDVVLLRGGAVVAAGWLERLAATAREPLAANVFALPAASDPRPGAVELPPETTFAQAADRVAALELPGRPRVPGSSSGVVYLRRAVLMLVGPPDESLTNWEEFTTDLAQRAVRLGFVNLISGDVLVAQPATWADEASDAGRWPWISAAQEEVERPASPSRRAAARARRAIGDLTVTLDCRSVGPVRMGTQTHALGLALALAQIPGIQLRALVAHDVDADAAALLDSNPATVLLGYDDAVAGVPQSLVVHRPEQVNTADDLALLSGLGERLVITHQDLIGYRNPSYHDAVEHWMRYRRATRYALGIADRVLFFSHHARDDALAEDLIDPDWADVVGLGVDLDGDASARRPDSLPGGVAEGEFLLCLGTDLGHKNLPFAIDVWTSLCGDQGWSGHLVLAGPHVPFGSTRSAEEARMGAHPELATRLIRLGAVDEAEKHWLLEHSAAVLYPTIDEGFGLLPFEAARAGTACAHAGTGALAEVLSGVTPVLVPWDTRASAAQLIALLRDRTAHDESVAAVLRAAQQHTWKTTAERVAASYERALSGPRRAIAWEARDRLATEVELGQLRGHVMGLEQERDVLVAFRDSVGEDGARLVGPHPLLDARDRRALLAVVARPALRRPFLAALRLAYRLGHR